MLPVVVLVCVKQHIFIEVEDTEVKCRPTCDHAWRICLSFIFATRLLNQSELAEVAVTLNCVVNMNHTPGIAASKGA